MTSMIGAWAALAAALATAQPAPAAVEEAPDPRLDPGAFMDFAVQQACRTALPEGTAAGPELARRFPGGRLLEARTFALQGQAGRDTFSLLLPSGDELHVERLFPLGRLRRITINYFQQASGEKVRPVLSAAVNGECAPLRAGRIAYDAAGMAETLITLGEDFRRETDRQPLNPTPPAGKDPGGVAVAVVDTGVNYQLPSFAGRLARDAGGKMLGYDYWDMDDRPFDVDASRSPFFPLHHGTAVASILLREAPKARIVPYRYPRPDMTRMGALIADADAKGAVIVNMAMGSNKRQDWDALTDAAAKRPHMLFVVSAGNDGRDIDRQPVFPAALRLQNFLVVTSSDAFGRLAEGSNWGRESVDVMTPGEQVPVVDHRGALGKASGSSYAVPRIAAMAARLLAGHPDWRAADIKRAIVERARPSRFHETPPVRYGWIPDPTDDY